MVIFFSGVTFNQVIKEVAESEEQVLFPTEISNEIDFLKTVRQNITKYGSVDILILDESACKNTEDELIKALEMLRTMYDGMKIIVFAPYREDGDDFLTRCFHMGILNIINTDDFLEIREELKHCIREGKTFGEAVKYKESKKEKVVVKHEVKRVVNKRMIGIAGVENNIGVTHNAIILANFFRKKGFMVAAVEMNMSGAYDRICQDYGERKFQEGYFTLNGIDFYAAMQPEDLTRVLEHSYNVILIDFGNYSDCDRVLFERCEDRMIIAGSKSWEMEAADRVFEKASKDVLMKYVFCFNFTPETDYEVIKEGMGKIENVHFLNYTADPFSSSDFVDAEEIFQECLPEKEEEEKRGIMSKLIRRRVRNEKER